MEPMVVISPTARRDMTNLPADRLAFIKLAPIRR